MVYLSSCTLELRGLGNRTKKDGSVYYIVNCEDDEGTPVQFYSPSADGFEQGLKKGDKVRVVFELRKYQNQERLVVVKVAKFAEKVEKMTSFEEQALKLLANNNQVLCSTYTLLLFCIRLCISGLCLLFAL